MVCVKPSENPLHVVCNLSVVYSNGQTKKYSSRGFRRFDRLKRGKKLAQIHKAQSRDLLDCAVDWRGKQEVLVGLIAQTERWSGRDWDQLGLYLPEVAGGHLLVGGGRRGHVLLLQLDGRRLPGLGMVGAGVESHGGRRRAAGLRVLLIVAGGLLRRAPGVAHRLPILALLAAPLASSLLAKRLSLDQLVLIGVGELVMMIRWITWSNNICSFLLYFLYTLLPFLLFATFFFSPTRHVPFLSVDLFCFYIIKLLAQLRF